MTSPATQSAATPGRRDRVRLRRALRHQGARRADVDVTMVAKTTHHLFQPLLYQVATGILSQGEIAPPTREILSGQKNARVILGEVTDIDLEARTVTSQVLGRDTVTSYDSLHRRRRRRPVLLRQRPLRRVRPRHEEHRRRPRAARPHLRRLRDGRARRDPRRGRRPPADLRGRRRRPDRRGDGRPDRRARAPHAQASDFRAINTRQARVDPARRRPPGAAAVRRQARREGQEGAREARRRGACSARW